MEFVGPTNSFSSVTHIIWIHDTLFYPILVHPGIRFAFTVFPLYISVRVRVRPCYIFTLLSTAVHNFVGFVYKFWLTDLYWLEQKNQCWTNSEAKRLDKELCVLWLVCVCVGHFFGCWVLPAPGGFFKITWLVKTSGWKDKVVGSQGSHRGPDLPTITVQYVYTVEHHMCYVTVFGVSGACWKLTGLLLTTAQCEQLFIAL